MSRNVSEILDPDSTNKNMSNKKEVGVGEVRTLVLNADDTFKQKRWGGAVKVVADENKLVLVPL